MIFLLKIFTSIQKTQIIKKERKAKINVKIVKTIQIKATKKKFMQSTYQNLSLKNEFNDIYRNVKHQLRNTL